MQRRQRTEACKTTRSKGLGNGVTRDASVQDPLIVVMAEPVCNPKDLWAWCGTDRDNGALLIRYRRQRLWLYYGHGSGFASRPQSTVQRQYITSLSIRAATPQR